MKKRLPPLNWLRSFEASARHLSFTQAANELNLTQAAISQQVKGLESQLGVTLFKRLPRGLELTSAGLSYMPVVHESVERLAVATDELFGKGQKRQLTIRVNLVFFTNWLAPRLAEFREQYPDVVLRFTSNIWIDEKKREDDMEIRYGQGVWPGLMADRLTWDQLCPVCSPSLIAGNELPLSPEVLNQHTLLHVLGYEEGWGYWLNQAGFGNMDSSQGIQFDTLITALEMANEGQGFALGRTSLVKGLIEQGKLIAPFDHLSDASDAFYLVRPINQFVHPDVDVFRAWLIDRARVENGFVLKESIAGNG